MSERDRVPIFESKQLSLSLSLSLSVRLRKQSGESARFPFSFLPAWDRESRLLSRLEIRAGKREGGGSITLLLFASSLALPPTICLLAIPTEKSLNVFKLSV